MFVGWVYDKWGTDEFGNITQRGSYRQMYMDVRMPQYIDTIINK
jgi:hypothetical protein